MKITIEDVAQLTEASNELTDFATSLESIRDGIEGIELSNSSKSLLSVVVDQTHAAIGISSEGTEVSVEGLGETIAKALRAARDAVLRVIDAILSFIDKTFDQRKLDYGRIKLMEWKVKDNRAAFDEWLSNNPVFTMEELKNAKFKRLARLMQHKNQRIAMGRVNKLHADYRKIFDTFGEYIEKNIPKLFSEVKDSIDDSASLDVDGFRSQLAKEASDLLRKTGVSVTSRVNGDDTMLESEELIYSRALLLDGIRFTMVRKQVQLPKETIARATYGDMEKLPGEIKKDLESLDSAFSARSLKNVRKTVEATQKQLEAMHAQGKASQEAARLMGLLSTFTINLHNVTATLMTELMVIDRLKLDWLDFSVAGAKTK